MLMVLDRYVREHLPHYFFVAPPGRLYSYANAGFSLIGYITQVVTSKRFPDLMQELVFDPLVAMTYPLALPHILSGDQLHVLHTTAALLNRSHKMLKSK